MSEMKRKGIVLYTDGGCFKSNPGPIGSGVHGYIYQFRKDGDSGQVSGYQMTTMGYVPKGIEKIQDIKDEDKDFSASFEKNKLFKIHPIQNVNLVVPIQNGTGTNNQAELTGMIKAMELISRYNQTNKFNPLEVANIHCDSQYVVTGLNQYLDKWRKMNWVRADGVEVSNKELWQNLDNNYRMAQSACNINVHWIKGHNGDYGNEQADKLATLAAMNAATGIDDKHQQVIDELIQPLNGDVTVKKKKDEKPKHPLLSGKRLIFNPAYFDQSKAHYLMLDPGKDTPDNHIGKNLPDATLMLARLNEPDPYVNKMVNEQIKWFGKYRCNHDIICQGFLDNLFHKDTKEAIDNMENVFHASNDSVHNLFLFNNTPITMVMNPQVLAARHIDRLNVLNSILDKFEKHECIGVCTEFTSLFYKRDEKKGKVTLLPNWTNDVKHFKLSVGFSDGEFVQSPLIDDQAKLKEYVKEHHGDSVFVSDITMTFGLDLPTRNVMKHLESYKPRLYLITLPEGGGFHQYFCLIELTETKELFVMKTTHSSHILKISKGKN